MGKKCQIINKCPHPLFGTSEYLCALDQLKNAFKKQVQKFQISIKSIINFTM